MLEVSIEGARGVLLSVSGGSSMTLHEVNQAATAIAEHCTPDANVIFGATIDDSLGDEMRVTVIAAGFGGDTDRNRLRSPGLEAPGTRGGRGGTPPAGPDDSPDDEPLDDMGIPDFLKG
jgi:cell division protein FtsZ